MTVSRSTIWGYFANLPVTKVGLGESVSKYYSKGTTPLSHGRGRTDSLQTSRLVPPQDGRDITGEVDPSAHGDGLVNVTLLSSPQPIMSTVVDAVKDSGGQDAFNVDYNSGNTLGIGWFPRYNCHTQPNDSFLIGWGQYSTGGGIRNSAATSYLRPAIPRSNLDVLIHTKAIKLHPSHFSDKGTPRIRTVEIASGANGEQYNYDCQVHGSD
ncbi:hypothetical protein MPER_04956 [Moniliophthora perniciosa FA553]|nr:hypothetical protein MPER_04956 [Moniliophthora perniciosa FA553]